MKFNHATIIGLLLTLILIFSFQGTVPVMLAFVKIIANRTTPWFPANATPQNGLPSV